jgi:N-glycosylase/DNA lyase
VRATAEGDVDIEERRYLLALCRHILRLDDDLSRFYQRAAADPDLAWVTAGGGRMLCSPTVFEDVVKTICTTNCSWSGTERMVGALVEQLGCADASGHHAFPSPQAMAGADYDFYRLKARAGYRGAYLRALATRVAEGEIDLEALNDPEISDAEAEARLLALPGVGPYAAAHIMLTGLGRYGSLVLDSWTRPAFARLSGRKGSDQAIRRRFRRYGSYQGLAFWLYLTQSWVDD